MSNHFHILLEVPPMAAGGLSDGLLLKRLSALYSEAFVAGVAAELTEARKESTAVLATEGGRAAADSTNEARVAEIHARFTCRMHDLSQFMKGLLIRFTRWFNRTHSRTGTLWEERFKSVIVESGVAARTIAAYIDLNPVRAGVVKDPADFRWSSYGEAVGGGTKGNGRQAEGRGPEDAREWRGRSGDAVEFARSRSAFILNAGCRGHAVRRSPPDRMSARLSRQHADAPFRPRIRRRGWRRPALRRGHGARSF